MISLVPMAEKQVQIAVRIPEAWLKDAAKVAELVSMPGMKVTQTAAFRLALRRGLTALIAENRK